MDSTIANIIITGAWLLYIYHLISKLNKGYILSNSGFILSIAATALSTIGMAGCWANEFIFQLFGIVGFAMFFIPQKYIWRNEK